MPTHNSSSSLRHGFGYQDLCGLKLCFDLLIDPKKYQYIQFETSADEEDPTRFYFDDIIRLNSDDLFSVYQIKHRQDPSNSWTWEELLVSPKGKNDTSKPSLIKKWASSIKRHSDKIKDAFFITNGTPSEGISIYIEDGFINIEKIKVADLGLFNKIKIEIGTEEEMLFFFQKVQFLFSQKGIPDLEKDVRDDFYKVLSATEAGVDSLLLEIINESSKENTRQLNLETIREWCEFDKPRPLNENFEIPEDFEFFDGQKNEAILKDLVDPVGGVRVIIGKPGVGKSVYLSKLADELKERDVFTVKHHFHLSPEEENSQERLNHERVIEALKAQFRKSDDLGDIANKNSKQIALREFINEAAQSLHKKNKTLVIIIDGLDHVLRYADKNELESFLKEVCFPQSGLWIVIGMQPHTEEHLPQIIIDKCPKNEWIEIKGLSVHSIAEILKKNIAQLNLPSDQTQLELLIKEIYKITDGNSLHLRYTLKQLKFLLGTAQATAYSCKDLVPYGGDIEKYYQTIWRNTSEAAKTMLSVVSSVNFIFIEQQLISCAGFVFQDPALITQSFKEIEHLISVSERKKISVYHNSFEIFLNKQFETVEQKVLLKQKIKAWLDTSNSEELKWSELRIIEHEVGNDAPILEIDRKWLIDAICHSRNPSQISRQMKLAANTAFSLKNFAKALEISHLHTYYLNSKEFVEEAGELINNEAFVLTPPNFDYTDLSQQANSVLITLARQAESKGDVLAIREIIDTFIEKLPWQEFRSGVLPTATASLIQVIPYDRKHKVTKVYKYVIGFRDLEISERLFRLYTQSLFNLSQENKVKSLLLCELTPGERRAILDECARFGFRNSSKDCSGYFDGEKDKSLLAEIHLFLKSKKRIVLSPLPDYNIFPRTIREHDNDERDKWRVIYHDSFLLGILYCLSGQKEEVKTWISKAIGSPWSLQAMKSVLEAACLVADGLSDNTLTFSTPFKALAGLEELIWPGDREELNFQDAFRETLKDIFRDLYIFLIFNGSNTEIGLDEYGTIVSKPSFFNSKLLLNLVFEIEKPFLTREVFVLIKDEELRALQGTIATLSERAVSYADLAKLSRIFAEDDKFELLEKATDNLLGYGYHKDAYLFYVIEAIESWIEKGQDAKKGDDWIRRTARLIEHIGEYTDGDETGNFYLELADLLAKFRPRLLYKNYYHFAQIEELRDAEDLFKYVINSLEFNTKEQVLLGSTALDKDSFISLQEISTSKPGALQSLQIIHDYLGSIHYPPEKSSSSDFGGGRPSVDYSLVAPSALSGYLTASFENTWERNNYISGWIAHWLPISDPGETYNLIMGLKENLGTRSVSRELLDILYPLAYTYDNGVAFDLLIEAQISDHGWERFWTEKEKAISRWSFLKEKFPGRYLEFFQKSTNNHVPLSRGVEFFLFFNDVERASELIDASLDFAESLTADISLEMPAWMDGVMVDELDLLLQRLLWPSALVRERAAHGIAKLLSISPEKELVLERLLDWIRFQKMESAVTIGLLPIIKAFYIHNDAQDLGYIALSSIVSALSFSSIVIDKLLGELATCIGTTAPPAINYLDISIYQDGYLTDSFFDKYIKTFLAPIYLMRAKTIKPLKGKDFIKQWAFTASVLAEESNVRFNANQCYYYSQREGSDLLRGFSSNISEVYRSAFLRVLQFYYKNGCIPDDFYLEYAYATLPVELSKWKVGLNKCPEWWPKFKANSGGASDENSIDQLQLEESIERLIAKGEDKLLLAAEGAIEPSTGWKADPMHSFSLLSFGYKVIGSEIPSPQEVMKAINYHPHLVIIPSTVKRPFHFLENQDRFLTTEIDEYIKVKDLLVYPIISREKDLAIGLWQYFRDVFDGLNIHQPITKGLKLELRKDTWIYKDESDIACIEHGDWLEGLKERYDHDLPIPYGDFLTAKKDFIEDWKGRNNLRIGYILKIDYRFKKYSYEETKEFEDLRFINVGAIITP